jgi:hypothetical protein
VRTSVLACGFGLGIGVMAELLGIGEVILEQARSPALQGGGDLVVVGVTGSIDSPRLVLSSPLGGPDVRPRLVAASPSTQASLYLVQPDRVLPVRARGGVPSLEKAVGDPEVAGVAAWVDAPLDARWIDPDPADVLRSLDRFHTPADVPEFASSWAEWLYFNGRSDDGRLRFYLTFLVGPEARPGVRDAGVRLQLDRDGKVRNYSESAEVDARQIVAGAPDLDIAGNRVRLEGLTYKIALALGDEDGGARLTGSLELAAEAGRSLPPLEIHGARGWISGYVVPVLSGRFDGALTIGGQTLSIEDAAGYHDHNWGFWRDVRWQWGQVAGAGLSLVFGRVFPPADVADPAHMPGFLGVLGPEGLIGAATDVSIEERDAGGTPKEVLIDARGRTLDVHLAFSVDRAIRSELAMTGGTTDFLQLGGTYRVSGRAAGRTLDFTARGAAETFRSGSRD